MLFNACLPLAFDGICLLCDGQSSIVLIITPLTAIMKDQIIEYYLSLKYCLPMLIDALSQSPLNNLAIKKKLLSLEMFLLSVALGISFPQPTHTTASSMM